MKLEIELVPSSTWGWNLRSELSTSQWDKLRKSVYLAAGHRCEVCGGKGSRHPVECHERWAFNDTLHTQTLVGLEALCPKCHMVRHLGLTFKRGLGHVALEHLVKVNEISLEEVEGHVKRAFDTWQKRSSHPWHLNTSWLETYKRPT